MRSRHQADRTTDRATSELTLQQLHGYVQRLISGLSEREAGVVRLRFGLDDGHPRTLDEIGQLYGVTRERIRQIERRPWRS